MTTSRQRRKQKGGSSSSARSKRATQKRIQRAPSVKGPAVVQEQWDRHATLRQNYRRLGLLGDVSMRDSGGSEKEAGERSPANKAGTRQRGMARVTRDADGQIIAVDDGSRPRQSTAWGDALNSDDEEAGDAGERAPGQSRQGDDGDEPAATPSAVVQVLQNAAQQIRPQERHSSAQESAWLQRLVSKHGRNITAMSRDRQENVWQKTPGEIQRSIDKAGGLETLLHLAESKP